MKTSLRFLSLLLAVLMLAACFISCGGAKETESEAGQETATSDSNETASETEELNPRLAVKDNIPTDLSFEKANDNTVTFFIRDDNTIFKHEMDVDQITNDTLWDAIYERNTKIEDRLGIEITTIGQPGAYGVHDTWFQTLRNAVNTKSGDYDAASIYMSQGSALALEGMYYNLVDYPYIALEKPWWNQDIIKESTVYDTLFYLAGDIAISEIANGYAFFYNKNMFDTLYHTRDIDLYQMVRDGEWTVAALYDFCSGAWVDSNSSGIIDDGDTVGYTTKFSNAAYDVWVEAMDIHITTMEDGIPVLSFYNERTVQVYEALQDLHFNNPGVLSTTGDNTDTKFLANKVLFQYATLNTGTSLRNAEFDFGVLPIPKYDEDQENYRTGCNNTASLIVILSSLPGEKVDMVGATLELMAAGSYREVTPLYYDVVLKSKFSNSLEDAEMFDLILNSYTFSFGFLHSTVSIAYIGALFRDLKVDMAQKYQSNKVKYETALETLLEKFEDLAFSLE